MSKMRKFFLYSKKGLTLVEIIVVMALMALIAGIAVPNLRSITTRAEKDTYESYFLIAKTHTKNFADSLTAGDTFFPVTENYVVTQYNITGPNGLMKAMNATNRQSAFEYYIAGDFTSNVAKTDPTSNLSDAKKDVIIPVIIRTGTNVSDYKYTIKGWWYYSVKKKSIIYTYKASGVMSAGWSSLK